MPLFPNEAQSFPDLPEGDSDPGENNPLPPLPANVFAMWPRVADEKTPPKEISEPKIVPMPHRPAPVMPVMPTVPDQLEQATPVDVEAARPQPEWTEPRKQIPVPQEASAPLDYGLVKRRRAKLLRFLVFEAIALAALLLFAKLEVQERFSGNSLTYLYGTVMFIAAIASALIPVIFYALPPRLPPAPPREM
jgi:hypothetical protein